MFKTSNEEAWPLHAVITYNLQDRVATQYDHLKSLIMLYQATGILVLALKITLKNVALHPGLCKLLHVTNSWYAHYFINYSMQTKPIFLFADSQLLFLKNDRQEYYLRSATSAITNVDPLCAYIGASNNDEPAFYELFTAAMQNLGLTNCKKISSSFNEDDREFLDKADLILLAGGDTELGLKILREKGIDEILQRKYAEGCILIGVSAGAVQLGWQSFKATDERNKATEALKFLPFIVLVHNNKDELAKVESLLQNSDTIKRAYEIPFGGGLIFHPDKTVEAIRKPINEFILKEDTLMHTLIFPENSRSAVSLKALCIGQETSS